MPDVPLGRGSVLLLYHRPASRLFKDAETVREHIRAFGRHSRFPVWELNTELGMPEGLNDLEPGAIVLHYSLFGSGNYMLDDALMAFLRRSRALKVAFFQDEYYFCAQRFAFVNEIGVDLVYTHVAPPYHAQVWGRYTPGARAVFNLPGYVGEELIAAGQRFARPDAERDIDVGYRGRPLPPHLGAGAQEKRIIGERFKELARGTPLKVDIETSERTRIYGEDWYRFLGRCRATLGVESGVSFMDLEDECHREYAALLRQGREPTIAELQAGALGRWEGNIPYRTMGPRHFEAAALRICQVLFEGEYSGAMAPGVHYVALAKDFSNFDEVVAIVRDPVARRRIVDRAYEDLVASGAYSYQRLVEGLDRELAAAGLEPDASPAQVRGVAAALGRGERRRRLRAAARTPAIAARRGVYRVVAPISRRVRRRLGLPLSDV